MAERVTIAISAQGVADVRLARPDKLNALDAAMFAAISAAIERLEGEPGLRAVVLSGEGRGFCAGLDMASFAGIASGEMSAMRDLAKRTRGLANDFQHVAWGWRTLPVPVIAALHGVAFGGGLQIALGADIRVAAPDTRLAVREIAWGLVPDMAGIALLRGLVRDDVARELCFSGREVRGAEAVALGLATRVADDPRGAALALADEIAGQSPDAVRAAKRLLNTARDGDAEQILIEEAREQGALIGSPNQIEAVMAGMAKRAPRFADAG